MCLEHTIWAIATWKGDLLWWPVRGFLQGSLTQGMCHDSKAVDRCGILGQAGFVKGESNDGFPYSRRIFMSQKAVAHSAGNWGLGKSKGLERLGGRGLSSSI